MSWLTGKKISVSIFTEINNPLNGHLKGSFGFSLGMIIAIDINNRAAVERAIYELA